MGHAALCTKSIAAAVQLASLNAALRKLLRLAQGKLRQLQ